MSALLALLFSVAAGAQEHAAPGLVPVGGILLFYDSEGPLSFVTAARSELPADAADAGEVKAAACQHGVSIPLSLSLRATNVSGAAGRGGYEKVLSRLKEKDPTLKGVYDVKIDQRVTSVLGLWRRLCVEVSARGFR